MIVVFGFFFATVSSRMVGIVGSSNNPVSGMAIATLIVTTFILKAKMCIRDRYISLYLSIILNHTIKRNPFFFLNFLT